MIRIGRPSADTGAGRLIGLATMGLIAVVVSSTPVAANRLVYVGALQWGVGGVDEFIGGRRLAISPEGTHVYVPGIVSQHVSVLARDAVTGAPAIVPPGAVVASPSAVAVSADGSHVYVTDQSYGVRLYARSVMSGALSFLDLYDDNVTPLMKGPASVAISPDGAHVYVGCFQSNSVLAFARDSGTGLLTYVGAVTDGVSGADGLERVRDIAVSPDGLHLYTAAPSNDHAVGVFQRDPMTGALTFVEVQRDGVGGVDGLLSVYSVAVSPDGLHLYATGSSETKVAVFSRNAGTGALTFVEAVDASPLVGVLGLAVSPDGTQVYVTGWGNDHLGVFDRDAGTGALTMVQVLATGVAGVGGLLTPFEVVVSPDSAYVYVSSEGGAVAAFRRSDHVCSPAPLPGCTPPAVTAKGSLLLKDNPTDARDKVVWRWLQGNTVTVPEFGDPSVGAGGTDYAFCVYDGALAVQPRVNALVPAGGGCGKAQDAGAVSCWKAQPGQGWRYASSRRNPDGVSPLQLRAGVAPAPRITLKAKGDAVPLPALPLAFPLTVQLQAANGSCWTATYSSALQNEPGQVRATAD